MPFSTLALEGTKKHIGTGTAHSGNYQGLKVLADVTITLIKGPKLIDDNGTVGQISSVALKQGDEFVGGLITEITVPNGIAVLLYRV